MAPIVTGLAVVLACWVALLLVAILATAAVLARIAAHLRDEAWARIAAQNAVLRHRERHLMRRSDRDIASSEKNGSTREES